MTEMEHPRVAGIVLAAGASRRLGRPKQLLDFRGKPLLQIAIDHARASRLDDVIVVLGGNMERIQSAVDLNDVQSVVNPRYAEGQSTSVIAALDALDPDVDAVLFLLSDQPGVTTGVIDATIAAFDGDSETIVMTDWQGTRAHPVLFGRCYFDELRELTGDQGAKPIILRFRDRVRVASIDRPAPQDVDTEADYQRLLASDQR